ncbi:O-antigen ligase family protein [Bacteroides bouchesdurhonensis]|uniref:O-antigen ligase family protein n=1 Tax=Bacteroides bouchesdurhonensis TaxID=1841855 RepID=UPI0011DDC0C7|nr:O-antigen ligase family protein [Bacteroides bouchesdurhonensis]
MGFYKESRQIYTKRAYFSEFMFVLFMFLFMIVKPVTQPTGYNGAILFVLSCICAIRQIIYNSNSKKRVNYGYVIFTSAVILFIIILNFIIRPSDNEGQYIYNYFLYGALPVFFLSGVKNYTAVLRFYCLFSIIVGFIYLADPLFEYQISGGYMPFGFNAMLPAFTGSVILAFYFKEKVGYLLALGFLLFSFIFSNKGATLAALAILSFGYSFMANNGEYFKRRIIIILILIAVCIVSFSFILEIGWNVARAFNVEYTYALSTLQAIDGGQGDNVFIDRYFVWDEGVRLYKESPDVGSGIGHFEKQSIQPYPHNFYLQVLDESGLLGAVPFTIILIVSFFKIKKMKNFEKKIVTGIILIQWIIPLTISLSYWIYMPFWIYWALCFKDKKENVVPQIKY